MTGGLATIDRPTRTRAEVVAALRVFGTVAVLGVPLGWVWSRLAPPEVVRIGRDGRIVELIGQSEHRFDALAVFLLLGLAVGVLTGAAVWLLRARRGPVTLLAAVLGALVAAWLAMRTGQILVAWRYAEALAAATPGELVPRAPVIESAWAVVAQPLGVALAYSSMVAWNGTDDLGR
ncbi:MAG: DUF2567 domain-containing protein [Pseudonocardiaceae bacterium]